MIVNNIFSIVNPHLSSSLSKRARKKMCSALILCHFDYSFSSWYAGLTLCLQKKIQIAQNKVIRFINSLGSRSRVTADTFGELNLLYVKTRVKQLRLNHVHKIFYELCPTYLKDNYVPVKDEHQFVQGPAVITS